MNTQQRALVFTLALFGLLLYLPGWSPWVTWAHFGEDGAELEVAARTLGIPHPTGYPLFLILGRVVALGAPVPLAAVNLLSLLAALWAVVAVGLAGRSLALRAFPAGGRSAIVGGLFSGMGFAVGLTWWRQAVIGEVYTLHIALAATVLALLFGSHPRRHVLAAYVLGLAFAHHLQTAPLLMAVGVAGLFAKVRWPRWALAAAAFAVPLTLYAVLLVRSALDPPLDWGNPESLSNLRWVVEGTPYHGNLLAGGGMAAVRRWQSFVTAGVSLQLGWGVLLAGVVGFAALCRSFRPGAVLLGVLFVASSAAASAYAIADPAAYYLPALMTVALSAGVGAAAALAGVLGWAGTRRRAPVLAGFAGAVVAAVAAQAVTVAPQTNARADRAALDYAQAAVALVPDGSVVLAHGDGRAFALWYATDVLHPQPNTVVIYNNLLGWAWYRRQLMLRDPKLLLPPLDADRLQTRIWLASTYVGHRPVFTTEADPSLTQRFHIEPAGPLFRLEKKAPITAAASSETTDREERLRADAVRTPPGSR